MTLRRTNALPIAFCASWLATGCATLTPFTGTFSRSEELTIDGAKFVLEYEPIDERSAKDVATALATSVPRLEKWGRFGKPVMMRIHPTHGALEEAVRRINYDWLRAWARYDSIDLQSPRTWGLLGASQNQLVELLTHELTHCLMYQRAATAETWAYKDIPLWFREGMASYTAAQGYRRPDDEELWQYLRAHPANDPVENADALYQTEERIVYGAAHRAFEFFVFRYGEGRVITLMDAMRAGSDFEPAFASAVGIELPRFTREYRAYVRWEGWRGRTAEKKNFWNFFSPLLPLVPLPNQVSPGTGGESRTP